MRIGLWVILLLFVTVYAISCSTRDEGSQGIRPGGSSPSEPADLPHGEPVIALWNEGALLVVKPFLLFAAWEDGTVIRRGEVAKPMGGTMSISDWAERKLTIGSVKPSEIEALQVAIAKTGFFHPRLEYGIVFPDGPCQTLCVRYGKARRLLSHQGPSDKWLREYIGTLGPTGSPTRKDAEAFVAMWDTIANRIDAVVRAKMQEFRGREDLARPKALVSYGTDNATCLQVSFGAIHRNGAV
jgi:hypothetical protein